MPLNVTCEACGRNFVAPTQFQGRRVKCKGCGTVFAVPAAATSQDYADSDTETDALAQLSAVATEQGFAPSELDTTGRFYHQEADPDARAYSNDDSNDDTGLGSLSARRSLAPNVLTFDYPGADDVDRWLPAGLIVLGFLLLMTGISSSDASGFGWISFTRFLTPSLLYLAFTFPIIGTMLSKAARSLKIALPPNFNTRTFACYMPAFVLFTWMQLGGEGIGLPQLFAGIFGLMVSSAAVWLLFRLREEHIGTMVVYGAGGFVVSTTVCLLLAIGINKVGMLVVENEHMQASVPVSPFGRGMPWTHAAPAAPAAPVHVAQPVVADASNPDAAGGTSDASSPAHTNIAVSSAMIGSSIEAGKFDPFTIPGSINGILNPPDGSPFVAVLRNNNQTGLTVERWDIRNWRQMPGMLRLPSRPPGNMVLSPDGQSVAWVSEFPRLCVQVWSFEKSAVVASIDLDRSQGHTDLLGFNGSGQLLIDRATLESPGASLATGAGLASGSTGQAGLNEPPVSAVQPTVPAAKPASADPAPARKRPNMFDDMEINPSNVHATPSQTPPDAPADVKPAPVESDPNGVHSPGASSGATPVQVDRIIVLDISTKHPLCTCIVRNPSADLNVIVPPGGVSSLIYGRNVAISVDAKKLAAVVMTDHLCSLVVFDLNTGALTGSVKVSEIDADLSACPTGLAFSNDGRKLAAMFESGGSALLLSYDAAVLKKTNSFVYPAGPLEAKSPAVFRGSSICWLDPIDCWCVYGQRFLSTETGGHIESTDIPGAIATEQRLTDDTRLQLLSDTPTGKKFRVLKLDASKFPAGTPSATD